MTENTPAQRIADIERELAELRASIPAHSLKPSMLQKMEDLEDELAELLAAQLVPRPINFWGNHHA